MDKDTLKIVGLISGGVVIGAVGGVLLTREHFHGKYESLMNQAIEEVKEVYRREYKEGVYDDPLTAAQVLLPGAIVEVKTDDAEEKPKRSAFVQYGDLSRQLGYRDEGVGSLPITVNGHPIGNEGDDDPDADGPHEFRPSTGSTVEPVWDENNMPPRVPGQPYVVTIDEYMGDQETEKISLTYYTEDGVLADAREQIVPDIMNVIGNGLEFFGGPSNDPLIVYIRNERLNTLFEVVKSEQSYTELILKIRETEENPIRRRMRDSEE